MKVYSPYVDQAEIVTSNQKNVENRKALNSIFQLWNPYYEYSLIRVLVIRKMRGISSFRQLVPTFFELAILGSYIASVFTGQLEIMAVVLRSYLVASVIPVLAAKKRSPSTFAGHYRTSLMGWG